MSFLKNLFIASASARLVEEQLYEYVAKEINADIRRDGLWVKAVEKSLGDEAKAKALYIQLRVQSLKDEATLSRKGDPNAPTHETHVLCPDCKELVLNEAEVCKHCSCKLVPLSKQGLSASIRLRV